MSIKKIIQNPDNYIMVPNLYVVYNDVDKDEKLLYVSARDYETACDLFKKFLCDTKHIELNSIEQLEKVFSHYYIKQADEIYAGYKRMNHVIKWLDNPEEDWFVEDNNC